MHLSAIVARCDSLLSVIVANNDLINNFRDRYLIISLKVYRFLTILIILDILIKLNLLNKILLYSLILLL